jgi:hypothetical protein
MLEQTTRAIAAETERYQLAEQVKRLRAAVGDAWTEGRDDCFRDS